MSFAARATVLAGQATWLLGWSPGAFWAATPAELAAILRAMANRTGDGSVAMDRAQLQQMMEADRDQR